jgi:hypothetical protein
VKRKYKLKDMGFLEISKWYESNPVARIIVNAIPRVGGSLDVALSNKWRQYHNNRIDDLLEKLQQELSDMKEQTIDKSVLESECFYDLVYGIAQLAISNRCSETRTASARIIKTALSESERMIDLEDLVRQISEFREKDYVFLKSINQLFKDRKEVTGDTVARVVKNYGYSPLESEIQLYRLEGIGLIDHPRNMLTQRTKMCFYKQPLFDRISYYLDY